MIKPPAEAVDGMLPVVRDMHTTSGLIDELGAGVTLAEAQEQVLRYVRSHIPDARKVPLCGNSIATDRAFLARDMPELDAFLHYRMVDVSSVKELARRWYPRTYFASPAQARRATGRWPISGRASRNCAYYSRGDPAGPGLATARQIASHYGVAAAGHAAPDGDGPGTRRYRIRRLAPPGPVSGSDFFPGAAMLHAAVGDGGCSSVG